MPSLGSKFGDRHTRKKFRYTVREGDEFVSREEWRRKFLETIPPKIDEVSSSGSKSSSVNQFGGNNDLMSEREELMCFETIQPPGPETEINLEIILRRDTYELVWENGVISEASADELIPASSYVDVGGNIVAIGVGFGSFQSSFIPGMYVLPLCKTVSGQSGKTEQFSSMHSYNFASSVPKFTRKSCVEDSSIEKLQEFGIVQKCSAKEKFATVKWYKVRNL